MLRWTIAFAVAAASLAVAAPATAAAQERGYGPQTIKCESWNYRPATCPITVGRRADIEVVRVIGGRCVEGQSWTWDRSAIRVSQGCRAIFAVERGGGGGGGNRETVACESFKYKYKVCALPGGRGRPELVRVIAGQCTEGRSWGGRRGEVWVDDGCRAIFASSRGGGGGGVGPGPEPVAQLFVCESWNYAYAECPTSVRNVVLDRVIAGDCREGRGWGRLPRGVWVNKGCRARFRAFA